MVHLNEMHEKYGPKGLTVVAVSKQDRSAVQTYVEELGVTFPTVCEKTDSMKAFGRTSYPSAFLIDTAGRVLWVGHPGEFPDTRLEEELGNAKILPAWVDGIDDVRKAFLKEQYADALAKAERHLAADRLDEEGRAAAEGVRDWLLWFGTAALETAAKAAEGGSYYEAACALEAVAAAYKKHELAAQAEAQLKELLADETRKAEVKAGERLAKILVEIRDLSPKKALKKLQPMLARKYEDTAAGKKAAELAKELEAEDAKG